MVTKLEAHRQSITGEPPKAGPHQPITRLQRTAAMGIDPFFDPSLDRPLSPAGARAFVRSLFGNDTKQPQQPSNEGPTADRRS